MLRGAMAELHCGNPAQLATDVGPVIDAEAKAGIEQHIAKLRSQDLKVHQSPLSAEVAAQGHFVAPTLIELNDLHSLQREVFGPVLHVLRYQRRELPQLLERINALGYGLTMGLHTRIDETMQQVAQAAHVGNLYVNRNMVGAVVGVQPFGGEGLSGTGPKAGGPLYLPRLQQASAAPLQLLSTLLQESGPSQPAPPSGAATALQQLGQWASSQKDSALASHCQQLQAALPALQAARQLPGPTGERNLYALSGKPHMLCLAQSQAMLLAQLAAVMACASKTLWVNTAISTDLFASLPAELRQHVELLKQDQAMADLAQLPQIDAALLECDDTQFVQWSQALAQRSGPIVLPERCHAGQPVRLERLWHERALSHNTAAAGGNAALMTLES